MPQTRVHSEPGFLSTTVRYAFVVRDGRSKQIIKTITTKGPHHLPFWRVERELFAVVCEATNKNKNDIFVFLAATTTTTQTAAGLVAGLYHGGVRRGHRFLTSGLHRMGKNQVKNKFQDAVQGSGGNKLESFVKQSGVLTSDESILTRRQS